MPRPNWHGSYDLRNARLAEGRARVLDIFAHTMPRADAPVCISPELAAGLRSALAQSGAYQGVERGVVSLSTDPIGPQTCVARGVMIPEAIYAALMNELGMPHIVSELHGPCGTCVFSKDGREGGWDAPCVSCGTGHPCYEPRPQLAISPPLSPNGEAVSAGKLEGERARDEPPLYISREEGNSSSQSLPSAENSNAEPSAS